MSECNLGGLGRIPDGNVSYSDHEPVIVTLKIFKQPGRSDDLSFSELSTIAKQFFKMQHLVKIQAAVKTTGYLILNF